MKLHHIYQKINKNTIHCFNIETSNDEICDEDMKKLLNIIGIKNSFTDFEYNDYVEYGPYLYMITPWCSNALNILHKCGLNTITRIEKSILSKEFNNNLVDKMTETIYHKPLETFIVNKVIDKPYLVEDIEQEKNLGFDEQDIKYYKDLFKKLNKTPNNVELQDLAQSNSEHSRHWFFNGKFIKENGEEYEKSLMDMIRNTQKVIECNISLIAFSDNASAIRGYEIPVLIPNFNNNLYETKNKTYHPVLTAETHNFPTSIAPFQGATTGTGGRIRDNQSIGRGGLCMSGIVGYSVGSINEGNYVDKNIRTLICASNGASDYGNKFGEPVVLGFCRSFGMTMNDNERIEYVKPIMFSAGIGQMDDKHLFKEKELESGIHVVRLGGPCLRIGIGGGSASSRDQSTENTVEDFNAVQRGDPEMGNRLNRVIRTCIEMGDDNPILSIHDQGAGGMANVTKEIVYPNGAKINLRNVIMGDNTMSVLEIWISEHQEQDTILTRDYETIEKICKRENLPVSIIGEIDNSGKMVVEYDGEIVVDFNLDSILGKDIPRKIYKLTNKCKKYISNMVKVDNVLEKILKSISVCSKRFLVNKVDRSVSGLIAQQQCCGSSQTPLSDYSITAQSYFGKTGIVSSIGERPTIGLICPKAMARMSIGEMLTNIMFCKIDSFCDIRCSGNWMWAMKMDGEKERLYDAVKSMCDCMLELGIALDGGKDSLSMSYQDKQRNETIKSLGTLVITGYTTTSDISCKITPDFKEDGNLVYYLNFSNHKYRLGGSAYYQEQNMVGDECPDFEDTENFKNCFNNIQMLIKDNIILSGHDVSDGGLIVSLLEMCFSGNKGFRGNVEVGVKVENFLYSEEMGVVIEIREEDRELFEEIFEDECYYLGKLLEEDCFELVVNDYEIKNKVSYLRNVWESTSMRMDMEQTNKECVEMEYNSYTNWKNVPKNFEIYTDKALHRLSSNNNITTKPKVAIIREEGSNGDREMASVFYDVGFEVYDYTTMEIVNVDLSEYRGMIFVGGFSYSDVFGAGRGWYSIIINNPEIKEKFDDFYNRPDTFSLGVCNGCQLMTLLGWIPKCSLVKNKSERFESRFSRVRINNSKSIMLKDMENCVLGVWTAHGEGRFLLTETINSIPIQYVDNQNLMTEEYPYNPNGSELGIAGICSGNGRHLAMMPHPERCYIEWQKPIDNGRNKYDRSMWYLMFKNAFDWCSSN